MTKLQKKHAALTIKLAAIRDMTSAYMKQYAYLLDSDNEDDIDAYTNLECDKLEELKELETRLELKAVEAELLKWARRKALMVATLDEAKEVAIAFDAAERNVVIRKKVIDAALRLR